LEKKYAYHLSGYTFETNVEFPELISSKEKINGSIFINSDINEKVPLEALNEKSYYNKDLNLSCINNPLLGFISIWNKKDIEMTPPPNKDDEYIRMMVLGSVSMLLSNCFGNLSLHAASVVINNRAVVFCAKSGKGKSSLAAYFHSQGYEVLSDDVTNIYINEEGEAIALPSVPRIKLSKQGLKRIGKSHDGLDCIPAKTVKYSLPLKSNNQKSEFPISHIFFLEFSENLSNEEIIEITGLNKLVEIKKHIYRSKLGAKLPLFKHKSNIIFNLISKVEMNHFIRSADTSIMLKSLQFIENKIIASNN
jgi:hypothetical protein